MAITTPYFLVQQTSSKEISINAKVQWLYSNAKSMFIVLVYATYFSIKKLESSVQAIFGLLYI